MAKKTKKTPGNSHPSKKPRTESPSSDTERYVSPEPVASSTKRGNNGNQSSKKNVPSSDAPQDKKGFHSLISSFELSENAKYVVEHGFEKSSKQQIEKILDEIIPPLVDRMTAPNAETNSSVTIALSFLKTLQRWTDYGKRHMVQRMFTHFSTAISDQNVDSVWRTHMVQLITKFVQTSHFNEHSKFGLLLLGHLFSVALGTSGKPVTSADFKRLKELKIFILQVDLLDPSMNDILASFMEALVSPDFLKNREGILVLANFLSKEASLVKNFQTKIRDNLSKFTKKIAANYGEVYFHAWILTEEGSLVRKEIEQRCIQDIMVRAMTLKRNGLEMGPIGKLVFGILQVLRANRRLTKFSQLITELYQPILWRSLKSHNPIERCNAAQIFFDVFPLEKVGQGATANCAFKEMQVKEIKDLLLDEYQLVRVIACRGVASVFIQSTAVFSIADVQSIMFILTGKLVSDSCHLVPAAVFSAFEHLVANAKTRTMAIEILKNMKKCLHDVNEKVRKSFVRVLLRLKEIDDPDARFWTVVPLKHILFRLEAEDSTAVGEMLARLMYSTIYCEGQTITKTLSNLIKIINISDVSLMKFVKFAKKEVKVLPAYNILVSIVGVINSRIKEKMSNQNTAENEGSTSDANVPVKRKKKPSTTLQNITNRNGSEEEGEESSSSESPEEQPQPKQQDLLDDHKVIAGLLNAASLLWATYGNELRDIGKYDTINHIAISCVPLLLRYYKGTRVYYTVVSFASLIPIQLLAPHSTVTGACIAELREMDESSDPEKMKCLVMALCLWNRGHDVVELAVDWLNQAFRHENLNRTFLPRSNKKKNKVRFRPTQGKPFMAIRLLEVLFGQSACEQRLLKKNYDQLHDTFVYLGRIKELIERRLDNCEEFKEPDLCDGFLVKCFEVYLQMILMLHRPDTPPGQMSDSSTMLEPLSAPSVSCDILNWAHRVFMPHLAVETGPQYKFASECLQSVLKSSIIAINMGYTDKMHTLASVLFFSKLIDTGSPLHFLEITFELIKSICEYSQVYNAKDEWEIFSLIVPKLLQQYLEVVPSIDITPETLSHMMENYQKFKLNLFYPFTAFKKFLGVQNRTFQSLCDLYLSTCLQLITREIAKTNEVEVYSKFDDHPFIASLIVKYFLSKPHLAALILPWLQAHVIRNKDEPLELMGSISFLSTILLSFKSKFQIDHLEDAISKCYEVLMALDDDDDLKLVKRKGEEIILDVCKASGCALRKS
uniref:Condensin-2 complex subunit G2 n=1 Tax=Lygus hesperus TaxID=30085 RepID=A0A0A9ZGA2_LYGHE